MKLELNPDYLPIRTSDDCTSPLLDALSLSAALISLLPLITVYFSLITSPLLAVKPSQLRADAFSTVSLCSTFTFRLLWPLVSGLWILLQPTMRSLLESSWLRFGPAGRDSLDWSTVPSPLPSTDRQATGQGSGEAIISTRSITYIAIGTASFLVLFVSILGFLICRRRRSFRLDGKLDLANVIALEDLQDPERNCELLSSLRRSQFPSSSSEQDVSDGVFLMVYLPPPMSKPSPGSPGRPAQAAPRTWSCCHPVLDQRRERQRKKGWE
ncbi:uncharacterized protein LOC129354200 [Poeciliopsis prolifica]|uniref:uncharacterized protein LOC129354200 n=1 Tax=Poeciliopsis prolifica TaxID=188132 RepID=UPI002413EAEC|nr:uncharacterized protein LOC129354200 [Poeciliopsis prolifica]